MITSNPLTPPRIAQAKGAKRQSAVAAGGGTGTVGGKTVGARTVGGRTVGARTVGARTVDAKTVGGKTKALEAGEADARRPVIIEIFKR